MYDTKLSKHMYRFLCHTTTEILNQYQLMRMTKCLDYQRAWIQPSNACPIITVHANILAPQSAGPSAYTLTSTNSPNISLAIGGLGYIFFDQMAKRNLHSLTAPWVWSLFPSVIFPRQSDSTLKWRNSAQQPVYSLVISNTSKQLHTEFGSKSISTRAVWDCTTHRRALHPRMPTFDENQKRELGACLHLKSPPVFDFSTSTSAWGQQLCWQACNFKNMPDPFTHALLSWMAYSC